MSHRAEQRAIISMIVAIDENNVIGRGLDMLWDLPDDMLHFKNTTSGHPIIMGRKTFETFPKPLKNRKNIVITANKKYRAQGAFVAHNLDEAFDLALEADEDEIFIIGGGEIYRQAFSRAERLYLTVVHGKFEGDVYFPEVIESEWEEYKRVFHPADERHEHAFTIRFLDRV